MRNSKLIDPNDTLPVAMSAVVGCVETVVDDSKLDVSGLGVYVETVDPAAIPGCVTPPGFDPLCHFGRLLIGTVIAL